MTLLQSGITKSLAEDYTIDQSLRFNDGDTPRLQRTWSGGVDNGKNTWSFWFKRGTVGTSQFPFWFGGATQGRTYCEFQSGDTFQVYTYQSSSVSGHIRTTQLFRDPTAWYHIVITIDTSLASGGDRMKLFVNGERVTALNVDTNPTQDQDCGMNGGNAYNLISSSEDGSHNPDGNPIDGYLAEFYFIQNTAYEADSFGETDSATNQWKPKDASGLTFGTNGFYQKYASTELADSFTDSSSTGTLKHLTFDGSNDYVAATTPLQGGTSYAFTISGWARHSGNGGYLWSQYPNDSTGGRILIGDSGSALYIATGGTEQVRTTSTLTIGNWYHFAFTRLAGSWKVYINGSLDDSEASGDNSQLANTTQGLGRRESDPSTTYWAGEIVQFATWNTELSSANVTGLYNSGDKSTDWTTSYSSGMQSYWAMGNKTTQGTDTASTIYDQSGNDNTGTTNGSMSAPTTGHPITAVGDVTNSQTQKKIGDSSIAFDGTGDYLTTPSAGIALTGDFTIEFWFYTASSTSDNGVMSNNYNDSGTDGNFVIRVNDSGVGNNVSYRPYNGTVAAGGRVRTPASAWTDNTWTHCAVVRSGSGTGNVKIYIDGSDQANQETATESSSTIMGNTSVLNIGAQISHVGNNYINGYMDEIRISDSARYTGNFTPSTTAFTADSNTMLLIHSNWDGGLGADSSGNGNAFTATNLVATDQMKDSPTNNFATLNPLARTYYITASEGNLMSSSTSSSYWGIMAATIPVSSGKWYWEGYVDGSIYNIAGIMSSGNSLTFTTTDNENLGAHANEWGYSLYDGRKESSTSGSGTYGATLADGDIVGIALDLDNGFIYCSKNNTWQDSGDPTSGATGTGAMYGSLTGEYVPATSHQTTPGASSIIYNFGSDSSFAGNKTAQGNQDGNSIGDFYYEPPTDYLALSTSNLSAPEIKLPGDYFNTVLYTGTDSSNAITGVGFSPNLLSIKNRTSAEGGLVFDVNRGQNYLQTSQAAGQGDGSAFFTSLDSDGFTVTGTDGSANASGDDYVAWNWLAGGSGVANTTGNMDSTVSANVSAGFSIVTYEGQSNGATSGTVGHGLATAPELLIVKPFSGAGAWTVGSTAMGWNKYLELNQTSAEATDTGTWTNTAPTASVFSVGASDATNEDDKDFVAYCFHSVEGYSKVGSYTGNGNADGAFVYTGFRPAFVFSKGITNTSSWRISDDKRIGYNVANYTLFPNDNSVEDTTIGFDIVSNGLKIRTSTANLNGGTVPFLYYAVAESPFKYANAR